MKILRSYGIKGGVGKSMLAKQFADAFARGVLTSGQRLKVCIIDIDPLRACFNFYNLAKKLEEDKLKQELLMSESERRLIYLKRYNQIKDWSERNDTEFYISEYNEYIEKDIEKRMSFHVFTKEPKNIEDYDIVIYDYPPQYKRDFKDGIILMPTRVDSESFLPSYTEYLSVKEDFYTILIPNLYNDKVRDQKLIFTKYFAGRHYLKERACYQNAYRLGTTIFGEFTSIGLAQARAEFLGVFDDVKNILINSVN
ncbi:TPA: AAA family ATPase [Klebsiella aerogenes]